MELIDAKYARNVSDTVNRKSELMDKLMKRIEESCYKGNYSITLCGDRWLLQDDLFSLGYIIEYSKEGNNDDDDEYIDGEWTISWKFS